MDELRALRHAPKSFRVIRKAWNERSFQKNFNSTAFKKWE